MEISGFFMIFQVHYSVADGYNQHLCTISQKAFLLFRIIRWILHAALHSIASCKSNQSMPVKTVVLILSFTLIGFMPVKRAGNTSPEMAGQGSMDDSGRAHDAKFFFDTFNIKYAYFHDSLDVLMFNWNRLVPAKDSAIKKQVASYFNTSQFDKIDSFQSIEIRFLDMVDTQHYEFQLMSFVFPSEQLAEKTYNRIASKTSGKHLYQLFRNRKDMARYCFWRFENTILFLEYGSTILRKPTTFRFVEYVDLQAQKGRKP